MLKRFVKGVPRKTTEGVGGNDGEGEEARKGGALGAWRGLHAASGEVRSVSYASELSW